MRDRFSINPSRFSLSTSKKRLQWWGFGLSIVVALGVCSAADRETTTVKSENSTTSEKIAQSQSAEEHYERGKDLYEQEKYRQAVEAFTRAIELDSSNADAYVYRGVAYEKLEQNQKAISDYNQAIEINPDYSLAYYNRGNAYSDLEQYQKEISSYTRAIEIDNDWGSRSLDAAYNNRGVAYEKLEQYQKAISDYNQAIEINPNKADAYYSKGLIFEDRGDTNTARINFERAAELYQQQGNEEWYRNAMEKLEELD